MQKRVAEIKKNSTERIHIDLSEFKVHDLVGLRVHYNASLTGDDDWRPTKKGVTFKLEKLPEIITALQQAEAEARGAGLLK